MKQYDNKKVAEKGKVLYCEELKRYATATTDKKHEWVEIDESEVKDNA